MDIKDISKAHQVGDRHPNGKYVWTEYQPGKFDWRIPGRSVERNKQLTERVQKVREALKDKQLHIAIAGGDDKSARSYPIAGIGQIGSNIMVRLKGVAQAVSIPVGKAEKMSFDGKRLKGVLPKYWTQGDLDCSSSASSSDGTAVWVSVQNGAKKGDEKSNGGGQNAKLISNLNAYHDRLMDSGWTKEEHAHNISAYRGEMEDALDGKKFTMKNVGAEPTLYYPDFKLDGIYNVRRGKDGMVLKFSESGKATQTWTHKDLCDLLSGKEVKMPDGDVYQLKTDNTGNKGTKKADTMENEDDLLKAHQVGDQHPSKPWVWTEYKPGKFDWRPNKNGAGGGGSSKKIDEKGQGGKKSGDTETKKPQTTKKFEDMLADPTKHAAELADYAKEASTQVLSDVVNNKTLHQDVRQIAFNALKKRNDYDATKVDSADLKGGHAQRPKATVQYKQAPKVEIELPDTFQVRSKKTGKVTTVDTVTRFNQYRNLSEDNLLNILNSEKANALNRQIAYEVAAEKGVDEDKIDVKGTLQAFWDKEARKAKPVDTDDDEDDEEFSYDLKHITIDEIEEFMEQFPEGDRGWDDKRDDRVKRQFRGLKTPSDRRKYDAFLDYQKRQEPDYQTPKELLQNLNAEYLTFMVTDMSPLFVSAGGAGVGKSYGFKRIANELGIKPFDNATNKPDDQDWGYVELANPSSEKEFRRMLKQYNGTYVDETTGEEHGRILVFDDSDSILTQKEFQSIMKNIAASDPSQRKFKDPDSSSNGAVSMIDFHGKIVIMTNKSMDDLAADEDRKAIMSRAAVSDVKLTINENIEILSDRYKTMHIDGLKLSSAEEAQAREEVFQFISDNRDKLDPQFFTVRKFIDVMKKVQTNILRSHYSKQSSTLQETLGNGKDWQQMALNTLNKAQETNVNNIADTDDSLERPKISSVAKKRMAQIKKKNPKLYSELFGNDALSCVDYSEADDTNKGKKKGSKKLKKALFSDMSLDDAENLLFG